MEGSVAVRQLISAHVTGAYSPNPNSAELVNIGISAAPETNAQPKISTMDIFSQSISPEVSIIQALQAQRDRLRLNLQYKPLSSLHDDDKSSGTKGALDQLEQGLREALTTINLDGMLSVGAEHAANARHHLKVLCDKLEGLVNPRLVPPGNSPTASQAAGEYRKLGALIGILQQDSWPFDLIAGDNPERTLFQAASQDVVMDADRAVDELNRFFKGLHQPSLREMLPQKRLGVDKEELERALRLHNSLKKPFEKLLHALQESSPDATKETQVLVQLVDSGQANRETFHLFLSSYKYSKSWLEVHLEPAPLE